MGLNPRHELIGKLRDRVASNADDPDHPKYASLFHGHALVAELMLRSL